MIILTQSAISFRSILKTSRKPISLRDDDPDAMARLCRMLHFVSEHTGAPEIGDVDSLVALAKKADKYDCLEPLWSMTSIWLDGLTQTLDARSNLTELFPLLEAAYLLDDAQAFQRTTKQIILHDEGEVFGLIENWSSRSVLPLKVYCKIMEILRAERMPNSRIGDLHKRRQRIIGEVESGLQNIISPLIAKQGYDQTKTIQNREYGVINHTYHKFNVHDCIVTSSYLRELRRIDMWGTNLSSRRVSALLARFHDFEQVDVSQRLGFATFQRQNGCPACALDTQSRMAALYQAILESCTGLCLDCLYKAQYPDQERDCRVKH